MKWHNFSILVCALAVSASAQAAQFVFVSPTQGTPAPTQIGTFDRVSPSGYGSLAPSLYLSATELSLGSVHIGESVTKAFTVINNSPKSISGITASVSTLMGDADAHVDVKCSPPLTLYSAAANEACDVLVTFNTSSAGTQTFAINLQGTASSYESVKGEFTFTAEVTDTEQPVNNGPRISFVTTAEDPNPNMYLFDQSYPDDWSYPDPVWKSIRIQNTGDTVLNEVIDILTYQGDDSYFEVWDSTCGYPEESYSYFDSDTSQWISVSYPAEPVTLAPGETCSVHVLFDAMTSELGFTTQATLTANSPSAGIITAGLTGKTTDLIPSSLDVKFASSLDETELPGWLHELGRRNEYVTDYLTQVGMFQVPLTGTETVTVDSVSITPLVGWAQQDALIYGGPGPGLHCEAGGRITAADKACNVYVGFQAVNGSNEYSFRLDLTGTSASGVPVTVSRTVSGVIPHELGIHLGVQGYSIPMAVFGPPSAFGTPLCFGGEWCGVYEVYVSNLVPEPVIVTAIDIVKAPGYSEFSIDTLDSECSSIMIKSDWELSGPDSEYPDLYRVPPNGTSVYSCVNHYLMSAPADLSGTYRGYMEVDVTVHYYVPSIGTYGSITERQYASLSAIALN